MQDHQEAMLKSLVAVAWADGKMDGKENAMLDAFVQAFGLDEKDAAVIREYAKTPRTIDDVPLTDLWRGDRELLLQHAMLVAYSDGTKSPEEDKVLHALVEKLRINAEDGASILKNAEARAKALLPLLQ